MVHSYRSSKLCLQEADSNLGLLPLPGHRQQTSGQGTALSPSPMLGDTGPAYRPCSSGKAGVRALQMSPVTATSCLSGGIVKRAVTILLIKPFCIHYWKQTFLEGFLAPDACGPPSPRTAESQTVRPWEGG